MLDFCLGATHVNQIVNKITPRRRCRHLLDPFSSSFPLSTHHRHRPASLVVSSYWIYHWHVVVAIESAAKKKVSNRKVTTKKNNNTLVLQPERHSRRFLCRLPHRSRPSSANHRCPSASLVVPSRWMCP